MPGKKIHIFVSKLFNHGLHWEIKSYIINAFADDYEIIFVDTPQEAQVVYTDYNSTTQLAGIIYVYCISEPLPGQDYTYAHPEIYINNRICIYRPGTINAIYSLRSGYDLKKTPQSLIDGLDSVILDFNEQRGKFLQLLKNL